MFMNDVENLTATQIAMLRAVADGEYQFNAMAIVKKYELGSAQTITRNKKMLVERDFVEKSNKNYRFSDPVFELWFRKEYMYFLKKGWKSVVMVVRVYQTFWFTVLSYDNQG